MLALFCLRLAAGMIGALLLLDSRQINPRFFRVHYLTAFALTTVAAFFLRHLLYLDGAGTTLGILLGLCIVATFLGSLIWSLRNAPGGHCIAVVNAVVL